MLATFIMDNFKARGNMFGRVVTFIKGNLKMVKNVALDCSKVQITLMTENGLKIRRKDLEN